MKLMLGLVYKLISNERGCGVMCEYYGSLSYDAVCCRCVYVACLSNCPTVQLLFVLEYVKT